jgi:hypothetical protein
MTKLTNKAEGPRSVYTKTGFVTISRGQTVDVELSEADAKAIKDAGVLEPAGEAQRAVTPGYPNLSLGEIGGAPVAAEAASEESEAEEAPARRTRTRE